MSGPDIETLFRLSHCSEIPIKQHGLGGVAQIAQLVAVYQYGTKVIASTVRDATYSSTWII
jgi:hypothetical protein